MTPTEIGKRFMNANRGEWTYKNPFVVAALYYVEGMSTVDISKELGCTHRTLRRYMNYYGMPRFTKRFSVLIKIHGIKLAKELCEPEYYPIGNKDELKLGIS